MVHQINPLGLTTHLQRVSTALPKDGKYTLMRGVDCTQLHSYCPAETPEGHGAGLLQNLALFARVRLGTVGSLVASALLNAIPDFAAAACGVPDSAALLERLEPAGPYGGPTGSQLAAPNVLVFVNGEPVAVTRTPDGLVDILRQARRAKVLPIDTSVIVAPHGVAIFTDMGTVQFPLISLDALAKKGHLIQKLPGELFENMEALGVIEYVEAWEALDYRVAFKPSDLRGPQAAKLVEGAHGEPLMPFTHLALHPMGILGTSASSVPWSDHDQAPRVSYQAGA
jgi:DNA-directed RNA polymerase II subunit RPB2